MQAKAAQKTKGYRRDAARRRILLAADFAYSSAKAVASGAIRFASSRQDIELVIHGGHPENNDPAYATGGGFDGIISCLGNELVELQRIFKANPRVPVVFASVSSGHSGLSARPSTAILCDNAAIAEAAAALFVRHGLTEFGYVGGRLRATGTEWDVERRNAFVADLERRGFQTRIYTPPSDDGGEESEADALAAWLKALPKPCGLLVAFDMRAMHVLNVCRAAGIAIPEQIQVISTDNEEWICEHTSPTLTSVEPDFEGCGFRAAETLVRLMDGETFETEQSFGVRSVAERMSTTDMHGSVNRAVRARKYLRANAAEPLGSARLAALLGCSPRLLQLSYKAVFGRTVQEDIAETRLDLAKKLLNDSGIPVCAIPERIGFESPRYFMEFFKARTGMTMLQWRRTKGAR